MGRNEEKARLALDAMRRLGFSRKQATPVLKRLFRLLDRKWEPIEAESYRALADAILDDQLQSQSQSQPQHQVHLLLAFFPSGEGRATDDDKDFCSLCFFQPNGGGGGGGGPTNEAPDPEEPEMSTPEPDTSTSRPTTTPQSSRTDFRTSAPPSGSTTATAAGAQFGGTLQRVVLPPGAAPAQTRPSTTTLLSKQMMDAEFQQPALYLKDPKPEPEPEPVDMDASGCRDVQPGLILRSRNRNRGISSSDFNALPLPDRNPQHISGSNSNSFILLSLYITYIAPTL